MVTNIYFRIAGIKGQKIWRQEMKCHLQDVTQTLHACEPVNSQSCAGNFFAWPYSFLLNYWQLTYLRLKSVIFFSLVTNR